ncbi:MAG: hypothetical protein EYC70_06880 [Planctomycetota bacterium]|nr:MAG: hypothetical protein EYC70_06880 [Planctomycetota bacterium]
MATCVAAVVLSVVASSARAQELAGRSPLVPAGGKPEVSQVTPDHDPGTLELKFVHGSGARLRAGSFQGAAADLPALNEFLDAIGAERERVFQQSEEWLDAWRARGEARSGRALHDLNLFFRIRLPRAGMTAAVCSELNTYAVVEIAYPVGRVSDPAAMVKVAPRAAASLGGSAPDFESMQGYRRAAPLGVDADFGNTFSGGRGEGHLIADVETGWTDDHEDIAHKALNNFIGLPGAFYPWDHGTAVLGELVGEDNESGVLGLVHQSDVRMSTHQGDANNIPTAVANAAAATGPGDVVVIEAQCFGTPPGPFPCEYVASTYATVETATANGVHVFAAAGNGNVNLDSAAFGGLFDRNVRDSGAVIVGASNGSALDKASFSNYGSRLDAHGWGFNVTTAGYGDLYGAPVVTREYTAVFSGTSSATPIVTGAGIILNGIHRECFGTDLDPLVLRALMTDTGTPQGSGGYIGPRPDVRAAIAALGIPTLSLSGTLIPGGTAIAELTGTPGDPFTVLFSRTLAAVPAYNPPYGYLYLGPVIRQVSGTIGAAGTGTVSQLIPNNPNFSGRTIGYIQASATFMTSPGTGTYSNWLPVDIQ